MTRQLYHTIGNDATATGFVFRPQMDTTLILHSSTAGLFDTTCTSNVAFLCLVFSFMIAFPSSSISTAGLFLEPTTKQPTTQAMIDMQSIAPATMLTITTVVVSASLVAEFEFFTTVGDETTLMLLIVKEWPESIKALFKVDKNPLVDFIWRAAEMPAAMVLADPASVALMSKSTSKPDSRRWSAS